MLKKFILIAALAGLALAACSPAATQAPTYVDKEAPAGFGGGAGGETAPSVAEGYRAANDAALPAAAPLAASGVVQAQTIDKLVIKNATLSLVVKNPVEASASIQALAEGLGGFVVSSNIYQTSVDAAGNKLMQANLSIRVPVDRLTDALTQLHRLAVTGEAESENITGEDVTAQYTDLESQLRNLEAAEAQLQKILADAKRTEDVLNVFNQLTSIRGQIEQVKGQMKYYRESAAMSLINISLLPDALSQPLEVGGWKAEGVAKDAIEALLRALQDLASAGIWLGIYVLPLVLIFGIPLWLIGRVVVRRMRKPRPAAEIKP